MKDNSMIKYIPTIPQQNQIALTTELREYGVLRFSKDKKDIGWMYHITVNDEWRHYYVIYIGAVDANYMPLSEHYGNETALHIRIDSGCITGMVFGDKSCECKQQLTQALNLIRKKGVGFIVHIPAQDGRGMGIDFKLLTLRKQYMTGFDTVRTARVCAGGTKLIDRRTYHGAITCLKFLGVRESHSLNVVTNNPDKISSFTSNGFLDLRETRVIVKPTYLTRKHLEAKRRYLGHLI